MNNSTGRRRGRETGGRKRTKQNNAAHSEVDDDSVPAVSDAVTEDTVASASDKPDTPRKRKSIWRTVFGIWSWRCGRTFAFQRSRLFFYKRLLKRTEPVEHVTPANWFCENCLKKFSYKKNWQKHICARPLDREELTCPMCEIVFTQKNNLNRHVKTVHEKAVRYSCQSCEKTYSRPDNAQSHMKVCRMNLFG